MSDEPYLPFGDHSNMKLDKNTSVNFANVILNENTSVNFANALASKEQS